MSTTPDVNDAKQQLRDNAWTVNELIRGTCFDHALSVCGEDDGTLYLTLYENVYSKSYGRLRLAWNALRGRTSYGNEIVFDAVTSDKLAALLLEHVSRSKYGA